MYVFKQGVTSGINWTDTVLKVYDVSFPDDCSVSSPTCREIDIQSYELRAMVQSVTESTFHDEMILLGIQFGDNGEYAPRIDKLSISNFDDDQSRRNLLLIKGIDSELEQLCFGATFSSKDEQDYLIVNYNSGGSNDHIWRFIFAEVAVDTADYLNTETNHNE